MRSWWGGGLRGICSKIDLYQIRQSEDAKIGGMLILDGDSISIMKAFSFRECVYRATSWVAGGFRSAWIIEKFYIFPTEVNLLISFWYDHAHYRRVVPEDTVYEFLDSRVRSLEERIVNPDGRTSVRRL